jgi:hypothetical protein
MSRRIEIGPRQVDRSVELRGKKYLGRATVIQIGAMIEGQTRLPGDGVPFVLLSARNDSGLFRVNFWTSGADEVIGNEASRFRHFA